MPSRPRAGLRLSLAGLALAGSLLAVVFCSTPKLGDRRCSPQGQCLTGYRCRQGWCVALAAEVCDGEDNNGDGFVDEDLYRATVRPAPSSETLLAQMDASTPGMGPDGALMAWDGSRYLAAWFQSLPNLRDAQLQYLSLDARLQPLGSVQTAAAFWTLGQRELAVAPSPQGFLIAYTEEHAPRTLVKLVRVDSFGTASPPQTVSDLGLNAVQLVLGWHEGEPAVAILHDPDWLVGMVPACGSIFSCEPRGIFLARPGRPEERLSDPRAWVSDPMVATGDGPFAISWAECGPLEPDGGAGPASDAGLPADAGTPPQSWCGHENVRARVRVWAPEGLAQATIPGARTTALAWVGEDLLAAWFDVREESRLRLTLTRLDRAGRAQGPDLPISDRVQMVNGISLAPAASEAVLVWNTPMTDDNRDHTYLARLDPARGRIGQELLLEARPPSWDSFWVSAFFTGPGYSVWLGQQEVHLAEVRCSDAPQAPEGVP